MGIFRRRQRDTLDQEYLRDCADMGGQRLEAYATYEEYYRGDQHTRLDDRAKKYLEQVGIPYAENFCEKVVKCKTSRMKVKGFDAGDETLSEWFDDLWSRNRSDGLQKVLFNKTLVKGDGFVVVEFDPELGRPTFTFNKPEIIKPIYDEDGKLICIVKCWKTAKGSPVNKEGRAIQRMNLHFPDRVEKYFAAAKDETAIWAPFMDEGDSSWPLPYVDQAGEPLGINIFHFRNGEDTWGVSEIHGTIPQQNGLNKSCIDLFNVMDNLGWKKPWVTGVDEAPSMAHAPGDFLWAQAPEAKFGELAAEDPTKAVQAIEALLRRMAARADCPLHELVPGGTLPSGEALKTAESPLVKNVQDKQTWFGNGFEDVCAHALRLQNTFGQPVPAPEDELILSAIWDDPQTRNEEGEWTVATLKKNVGVSQATILREMGYDPDEEAQARNEEAKASAEAIAKSLGSGNEQDDFTESE